LIPSQSCVTLTDGWFWKTGDENRPLKSAADVVEQWLRPQNRRRCNLICNAAPARDGRLAPNVTARLKEIGDLVRAVPPDPLPPLAPSPVITTPNLATGRPIRACDSADTYGPDLANDGNFRSSWYLPENRAEGWIDVDLKGLAAAAGRSPAFNTLVLAEPVGRWKDYPATRIARYRFDAWDGAVWRELASGDEPDPVRIRTIPRTRADRVRLTVWTAAPQPHLSEIGLYDEPARSR
jgi:alpha-L-fucosidase